MALRAAKYDANLPRNLTFRRRNQSFYWRNPLTGKEISLGKCSRRDAISQALEANNYIEQNNSPIYLLDKLKGTDEYTLSTWLERYKVIQGRKKISAGTHKLREGVIATINENLGEMVLSKITTRHIAEFLELWIVQGKQTMAKTVRSTLANIFREAVISGMIEVNPVLPTRSDNPVVKRERLMLKQYMAIRESSALLPPWFSLSLDLALVTAQRREDIASMRFDQVRDGRLFITQGKTGAMIAIPLSLELHAVNLKLGVVIDRCRLASSTDYMISSGVRKNRPDGSLNPDSLTKKFVAARLATGLDFKANPPTFHEIRSLAGRLYEEEKGKEFTRKLLGHKTDRMTEKYLDLRENKYVML